MGLNEIRRLFSYNGWANHRLLEASRSLSPAAFARDLSTSHGSLRGTFVHLLWGEWYGSNAGGAHPRDKSSRRTSSQTLTRLPLAGRRLSMIEMICSAV